MPSSSSVAADDVELGKPGLAEAADATRGFSLGGYHLADVGTSCLLPTPLFALWRVAVAVFLFSMLIWDCVKTGSYALVTLTTWSLLTEALVFSLLAAASVLCVLRSVDLDPARRAQFPASALAVLYQTSASATLFLDFVVWTLLLNDIGNFRNVTNHVLNFVLILIDVALSATLFRFINVVFFVALVLAYVVFNWIRYAVADNFALPILDAWDANRDPLRAGGVVWTYATVVMWAVAAGVLFVVFSRAKKLYSSKLRSAPMRI